MITKPTPSESSTGSRGTTWKWCDRWRALWRLETLPYVILALLAVLSLESRLFLILR